MQRSNVDFPAPLRPRMQTTSPLVPFKLTSQRTSCDPNHFETCSTWTTASSTNGVASSPESEDTDGPSLLLAAGHASAVMPLDACLTQAEHGGQDEVPQGGDHEQRYDLEVLGVDVFDVGEQVVAGDH